jgi:hypothetical protein
MSNFAARNLSLGQVNALVKKLGGETAVLAIIGGTLKFTLETVESQPYNGSTFFQTRRGIWVDSDLDRDVGLDGHITRGTLPVGRVLARNTSEADMFGEPGSDKYAATLQNAVDLGQIEAMIEAQWNGQEGDLLTNGFANIFPTVGKNGALHVVYVDRSDGGWYVYCDPFEADDVWRVGNQVFSN